MKKQLEKINIFPNVTVYKNLLPHVDRINQIVLIQKQMKEKKKIFLNHGRAGITLEHKYLFLGFQI